MFLPGESQGWRSLVGCRLWGLTESDMTERLSSSSSSLTFRSVIHFVSISLYGVRKCSNFIFTCSFSFLLFGCIMVPFPSLTRSTKYQSYWSDVPVTITCNDLFYTIPGKWALPLHKTLQCLRPGCITLLDSTLC